MIPHSADASRIVIAGGASGAGPPIAGSGVASLRIAPPAASTGGCPASLPPAASVPSAFGTHFGFTGARSATASSSPRGSSSRWRSANCSRNSDVVP